MAGKAISSHTCLSFSGLVSAFFAHAPCTWGICRGYTHPWSINPECPPCLLLSTLPSQWKPLLNTFSEDSRIMASCVKTSLSTMGVSKKGDAASGVGIRKILVEDVPFQMGFKLWVNFWKAKVEKGKSVYHKQKHHEQRPKGEKRAVHSRNSKWPSLVITLDPHRTQTC